MNYYYQKLMALSDNRSIGLSIYRVILSFLVLKNCIFYFPMADQLFGADAIVSINTYFNFLINADTPYLYFPFDVPFAAQAFILLMGLTSMLYLFGVGGRITGIILFFQLLMLQLRNGFVLDGSDNVMLVTMPFLLVANSYEYFRLSKPKFRFFQGKLWKPLLGFATLALLVQVCYVYFFTALHKLQGDVWLNGTAVYYTMRVKEFMATSWNIPLTENHYFIVLATYFTVFWEIAFAFTVWSRKTKLPTLLLGVMLHVGIWVFMRIDNFSWIMIGTYFVFVSNEEYALYRKKYWDSFRLKVLYDNYCPNCTRFGKLVNLLNFTGLVEMVPLRDQKPADYPKVDFGRALEVMASQNPSGSKIYYGFNSIYQITKRIPLFWLFVPALFVMKILGIGNKIYQEIAINRQIIPLHCADDCPVPQNQTKKKEEEIAEEV